MLIMVFLSVSGSLKQDFCVSVEIKVLFSYICALYLPIYMFIVSIPDMHTS